MQRREDVDNFIKFYRRRNGYKPSDVEIINYLDYQGMSHVVSWISIDSHFKGDELAQRGIWLFEPDNDYRYHWVVGEVVETPSTLNIVEAIAIIDIIVDNPSNWLILLVGSTERICNTLEGCLVPLNECIFTKLVYTFPFMISR